MPDGEFSLLLPNTGVQSVNETLEKAQKDLKKIDIQEARITCGVGAVIFIHPPTSSSEAMRLADDLMYAAKRERTDAIYISVYDGSESSQTPLEFGVHYGRRYDDE
ncbi:MAG: diguanylate cyclase [Abditibacteriaceae bacterium]